jgi:Ulp1 family protease
MIKKQFFVPDCFVGLLYGEKEFQYSMSWGDRNCFSLTLDEVQYLQLKRDVRAYDMQKQHLLFNSGRTDDKSEAPLCAGQGNEVKCDYMTKEVSSSDDEVVTKKKSSSVKGKRFISEDVDFKESVEDESKNEKTKSMGGGEIGIITQDISSEANAVDKKDAGIEDKSDKKMYAGEGNEVKCTAKAKYDSSSNDKVDSKEKISSLKGKRIILEDDDSSDDEPIIKKLGYQKVISVQSQEYITENELVEERNDEIWFTYPFVGGDAIEYAAKELPLCDCVTNYDSSLVLKQQEEVMTRQRHHRCTVTYHNVAGLKPEQDVDDVVVDFWLAWISRHATPYKGLVLTLNSYAYAGLIDPLKGKEIVSRWLEKFGDLRKYKFIFVPVNVNHHWSLFVIVNPNLVTRSVDMKYSATDDVPVILHFDSLKKVHNTEVIACQLRELLNYMWLKRGFSTKLDLFDEENIRAIRVKGKSTQYNMLPNFMLN